jgi:hypothetical protein
MKRREYDTIAKASLENGTELNNQEEKKCER